MVPAPLLPWKVEALENAPDEEASPPRPPASTLQLPTEAKKTRSAPAKPARKLVKKAVPEGYWVGELEGKNMTEQQKQEFKMRKLVEIGRRLSEVMEEARAGASESLSPPTLFAASDRYGPPVVMGEEKIMAKKKHGSSNTPVQKNLRWGVDRKMADKICNFNRKGAEPNNYFEGAGITFLQEAGVQAANGGEVTFYDSNTGMPLFYAPRGRTWEEFVEESRGHGWPSFRDAEVNWDLVRVLPDGETVSTDGTHLGHDLPDTKGNRYCINLICVAGRPKT